MGRWSKLGKICSTQLLNDPFLGKVKRKYRFPSQKTFTLQVYLQSARVPRIIKDFYTNLVLKKAAENQTICPEKISRLESDGISHQNKRIFGIFNRKNKHACFDNSFQSTSFSSSGNGTKSAANLKVSKNRNDFMKTSFLPKCQHIFFKDFCPSL